MNVGQFLSHRALITISGATDCGQHNIIWQVINWANVDKWPIRPQGKHSKLKLYVTLIHLPHSKFKHSKMSPVKWQPCCSDRNVLTNLTAWGPEVRSSACDIWRKITLTWVIMLWSAFYMWHLVEVCLKSSTKCILLDNFDLSMTARSHERHSISNSWHVDR